jgi:hypothetical protein
MEIYKETNLPDKGWIQGCFICYTPTAYIREEGTFDNNDFTTEYSVFLCHDCHKLIKYSVDIKNEYDNSIDIYIKKLGI